MSELSSNAAVIQEADQVQSKTKAALYRIQRQAAETQELGGDTLEEMREQRNQTQRIQADADDFDDKLNKTRSLQNRFDRWSGHWRGTNKRLAKAEASHVIRKEERARANNIGKENSNPVKSSSSASSSARPSGGVRGKVVKRPPKKRTDLLSFDLEKNPQAVAKLDDDTKRGLNHLVQNDHEIDAMLDQTAASLDQVANLSAQIQQETALQTKEVEKLTTTMTKTAEKQAVVNARAKRLLTGRWLKRNNETN